MTLKPESRQIMRAEKNTSLTGKHGLLCRLYLRRRTGLRSPCYRIRGWSAIMGASVAITGALLGCSAFPTDGSGLVEREPKTDPLDSQDSHDTGSGSFHDDEEVVPAAKLLVSAEPVFCCNPLTVNFSVTVENVGRSQIKAYDWSFGNGFTGSGDVVQHTYARAGTYTVTVTASTLSGGKITAVQELALAWSDGTMGISLDDGILSGEGDDENDALNTGTPNAEINPETVDTPPMPVANAGSNQTVRAGDRVRLDGSRSVLTGDPSVEFTWTEVSAYGIDLRNTGALYPWFMAPTEVVETITVTVSLRVFTATASATDTVDITVLPGPTGPFDPTLGGYPVHFLSGPEGDMAPGGYTVQWRFESVLTPSNVVLQRDCCRCNEVDTAPIVADADGVYEAMLTISDEGTVWYQVLYTIGGREFVSQAVYVNAGVDVATSEPPEVIWYYYLDHGLDLLGEVLATGVVTHVMLSGNDRETQPIDTPEVLDAVALCRQFGVAVIWSRHLWNNDQNLESIEDVFDPEFYIEVLSLINAEAEWLGADFSAMDGETYRGSPLYATFRPDFSPDDFEAMKEALDIAAETVRVDFVYPAGSHYRPLRANNLYPILARRSISESTYYDMPARNCQITHAYNIFGAFVARDTERLVAGYAPYFLPHDIVGRRYLWSASDGAPDGVNGLFLFPGRDPLRAADAVKLLSTHFPGQ